jgi:hypothetical protein
LTRVSDDWKVHVYSEEDVEKSVIYNDDESLERVSQYWNDI